MTQQNQKSKLKEAITALTKYFSSFRLSQVLLVQYTPNYNMIELITVNYSN